MHNTGQKNTTWEAFWKKNPTGFNSTMAQSTLFFAKKLNEVYPIKDTDRFLDIGCGPGFLIDYLKDKCEFVHGTDISEKYIEICEKAFAPYKNTKFSLSKVYDYSQYHTLIVDEHINRVIFLSILQYYSCKEEIKKLIESLKKAAEQQPFSCLLADIIPTKHSTFGDIFSIVKHAIKNGYTLKFIRFLAYAMFSEYRNIKKNGFLQVEESYFIQIAEEMKIDLKIIKDLTMHTGRYSVLIDFK